MVYDLNVCEMSMLNEKEKQHHIYTVQGLQKDQARWKSAFLFNNVEQY